MSTRLQTKCFLSVALITFATASLEAKQPDREGAAAAYRLGKQWGDKGVWEKAVKEFDKAVELDPNMDAGFEARGTARLHLGDWDKAIKDFTEAIRLKPNRAVAFSNRGVAWYTKGELDKALSDYDEAVRLRPSYSPAFHNRGLVWVAKGHLEKAIADLTEAIELNPRYEDAFVSRGSVQFDLGEYEKALKDYDKAVQLNTNSIKGLFARANLRATCPQAKFRDGTKALQDAKKAFDQLGERPGQELAILAAAYAEAGDFAEARRWQQKAIEDKEYLNKYGKAATDRLKLYEAKQPFRKRSP